MIVARCHDITFRIFGQLLAIGLMLLLGIGCTNTTTDPQTVANSGRVEPAESISGGEFPAGRIVDLTYAFDQSTIFWPTEPGFRLERGQAGFTEAGYYYSANRFFMPEHGGTHIDAPIHFYQDRLTVDKIPLERLIGESVVVDVTQMCAADRDFQIGVRDLRAWEEKHARVLSDRIVLLRTGWGQYWPDRRRYLGTDKLGPDAVGDLHFPGLDPDAARWLVQHRSIKAIGIDTPSIDFGQSRHFASHVKLFEHNVPALENVANLDQLPQTGAWIVALPMKIAGGTGGPTRIVAIVPDEAESRR